MAEGSSTQEVSSIGPKEAERLYVRNYLTPVPGGRKGKEAQLIGPWLINDANREIFIEEWTRATQSAKNFEQLASVINLAWDPHQSGKLLHHIESLIRAARPELKDKLLESRDIIPNNPEYDGIRRAVGEKLKTLGLTNSGINGNSLGLLEIFHMLHPNPYEEYTHTTTKRETRGTVFKKQVSVPVEKHGKRLRPYEELMTELLQYNQSQPTLAVPEA